MENEKVTLTSFRQKIGDYEVGIGDFLFVMNKRVQIVNINTAENASKSFKVNGLGPVDVWLPLVCFTMHAIDEEVIKEANSFKSEFQFLYKAEGSPQWHVTENYYPTAEAAAKAMGLKYNSFKVIAESIRDFRKVRPVVAVPIITKKHERHVITSTDPNDSKKNSKGRDNDLPPHIYRMTKGRFLVQINRTKYSHYASGYPTLEAAVAERDRFFKSLTA